MPDHLASDATIWQMIGHLFLFYGIMYGSVLGLFGVLHLIFREKKCQK